MDYSIVSRYSKAFSWETITKTHATRLVNNLKPSMEQLAYVIYTFDDCNLLERKIEMSKSLSAQEITSEMKKSVLEISPNDPCYILARFPYIIKYRKVTKYIFIMWAPDSAHVKEKMKASSFYALYLKFFKENALKNFPICDEHVIFNDYDDFSFEKLEEICVGGKVPPTQYDFSKKLYTTSNGHFEDLIFI
jgi:hypothetical protein